MPADLGDCLSLTKNLRTLGVPIPAALTAVLDKSDALEAVLSDDPAAVLTAALTDGSLAPATAAKALEKAATRLAVRDKARDLIPPLRRTLGKEFAALIHGDAGAEIITALRPLFDAAVTAIADSEIETTTTADEVLEMGPNAAQAWRDLPKHRQTLDLIHGLIIGKLVRPFDVLGHRNDLHSDVAHAAFLLDGAGRTDLYGAASAMRPPHGRGGGWLPLIRSGTGTLRLNAPSEARALLDAHDAAIAEREEQVRAASTPVTYEQAHRAAVANGGRITSLMTKV